MKKTTLLFMSIMSTFLMLFNSCTETKKKNATETSVSTIDTTPKVDLYKPQVINLGNNTIEFKALHSWDFNAEMTDKLKSDDSRSVEIKAFTTTYSDKSQVGLIYQKANVAVNLDGSIDGTLRGYTKNPSTEIKDKLIIDVSDKLGMPAKMVTGRLVNTTYKDNQQLQFKFLTIAKDKEIFLFQGLFEAVDGFSSKDFEKMLGTIKITNNN